MGGGGCRDQARLRLLLILPANGTEDLDIHNALMYSTNDSVVLMPPSTKPSAGTGRRGFPS